MGGAVERGEVHDVLAAQPLLQVAEKSFHLLAIHILQQAPDILVEILRGPLFRRLRQVGEVQGVRPGKGQGGTQQQHPDEAASFHRREITTPPRPAQQSLPI